MFYFIRSIIAATLVAVSSLSFAAQVDINTADAAALAESINGIGPSKAEAIVDYRTENGPFKSIDDLVNVQGIGVKTLDRIREFIKIAPAGPAVKASTSSTTVTEQPALPATR